MAYNFLGRDRDQPFLLPPDLRDWLPDGHLAGAFAECWVRTVREKCLDWMLIRRRRHLERVLDEYPRHDNDQRPHRGLALRPPSSNGTGSLPSPSIVAVAAGVRRRDRLGGLVHEYHQAAA
jgi:putative transposase